VLTGQGGYWRCVTGKTSVNKNKKVNPLILRKVGMPISSCMQYMVGSMPTEQSEVMQLNMNVDIGKKFD
jgi:hypothetical protein